ncbi:MAG: UDP-N-acetylmuramoyl-L-alanine--D-glutamate ligase [Desulfamplus sp.]|nr:UDP-N-acetylmuramoyl-L-alanine--D-glutamate ligase [Desulfamplus sp.]
MLTSSTGKNILPFSMDKNILPFSMDKNILPFPMDKNILPFPMDKNIVVAGLGRSGRAAAVYLKKQGFEVTATDIDPAKQEEARLLEAFGIHTETGFHNIETFENAGLIVVSPGIPITGDHFKRAMELGIPIRGELDLACELIKEPVIAITGTNGKTTVTTMISDMLKASGKKVFTGGNIGTPLISYLDQDERADVVVIEVSSFQLDTAINFKPHVALLLNITEDHLNRYPDFNAYGASKWSIFAHQEKEGWAIVNGAMDLQEKFLEGLTPRLCLFNKCRRNYNVRASIWSMTDQKNIHINFQDHENFNFNGVERPDFPKGENANFQGVGNLETTGKTEESGTLSINISGSNLKGKHNRENMEAAALAALCAGATIRGIETALQEFHGLPHRTSYVATINGVDFYNDSKATNTDAVVRAIEAFDTPIILIMGGEEKCTDFSILIPLLQNSTREGFSPSRVKQIVAMGASREKIKNSLQVTGTPLCLVDNMAQAVKAACGFALPGDTVLLSPACASFDMYTSYAHRGDDFIHHVNAVKKY